MFRAFDRATARTVESRLEKVLAHTPPHTHTDTHKSRSYYRGPRHLRAINSPKKTCDYHVQRLISVKRDMFNHHTKWLDRWRLVACGGTAGRPKLERWNGLGAVKKFRERWGRELWGLPPDPSSFG